MVKYSLDYFTTFFRLWCLKDNHISRHAPCEWVDTAPLTLSLMPFALSFMNRLAIRANFEVNFPVSMCKSSFPKWIRSLWSENCGRLCLLKCSLQLNSNWMQKTLFRFWHFDANTKKTSQTDVFICNRIKSRQNNASNQLKFSSILQYIVCSSEIPSKRMLRPFYVTANTRAQP